MKYLLLFLLSFPVFADHNSHREGFSADRGYNKENCEELVSKETFKRAEWLGHLVGCLIESNTGYVLVMEYKVQEMDKEMGDKLRTLVKEYEDKNNKRIPM